jgi:acyl-phosphate glycerol 3-phosphate acyltransferase
LLPTSVVLAAYLVGAVPFGFLVARARGVDILRQGSGNIGATNVGRVLGKPFGILVFVLDFLKGAVPTFVAFLLAIEHADEFGPWLVHDGLAVLAGLATFVGHVFPIYLHFKGGKGVATGAGVVAVLVPYSALIAALITWLSVVFISRYVSLASLCAAVILCFTQVTSPGALAPEQRTLTIFLFVVAALVFVRHRSNIVRLAQGRENRIRGVPPVSTLVKIVHVLAVGLWFGSAVFFNLIATPAIFDAFRSLGSDPSAVERTWLPLTAAFDEKLGTRLAGVAVSPLFPLFFLLQGVCGLLTTLTALAWSRELPGVRVHRVRALLSLAAMATVVLGWPLVQHVSALRPLRYSADSDTSRAAEAAFQSWHGASLSLSLITLVLVTVLMALAARLPEKQELPVPPS